MINKEQLAHEMAIAMQSAEPITDMKMLAALTWQYADAMQAECDKRKPKGVPEALEFKIDWSLAPEGFNWWAMDIDGSCYWYFDKPTIKFDQAFSAQGIIAQAPSFNFTGNWKDSLTERPNE